MSINLKLDGLLEWRCIGPFRGGRVVAVAGDVSNPTVFYFGACAGGVWKTEDAGQYWECVSDGLFNTASVGALAVSEVDPNVIYAGTGESTIRIDVSHGDGVYKSTDAGRTWKHIGLKDTRHIGKIRIHPKDPNTVFVAALGHAFGPNKERGVFKSTDGGETWKHVLFKSENAGAVDLSIDPNNPRIIYTSIWQARRSFWNIQSGGPDSGIWKSTDGGETWTDISRNKGLPEGAYGKIGIAASPAQSGRVWAIIENEKGGVYRSDNYGETWEQVSEDKRLVSRAWYYMHLTPDPRDGDTLYINNLSFWKSTDGGRTYAEISTPHGDNHDLWIDPNNTQRMVQGNDGGACVSFTGGASWSSLYNQPTAQFYHVATDNRKPYHVYGTQQDNSSIAVPSRSAGSSITWAHTYPAGTGESGYIAVNPNNPDIVYVGAIGSSPGGGNALQRYDHKNKQIRLITTWPEPETGHGSEAWKYRFAWTYPIVISPHDPKTIYVGGNTVMKSTNEGQSWEEVSPDLTRADPEKLKPSGGPVNRDAVGAETYATVFAFAESPVIGGVLWAGSDDGLVHVSKDNGEEWTNVTPKDLPEWTLISMIEASKYDAGTAYMAATKYKLDDYAPYLYKTTNYGKTWKKITKGIRENDFTRVIREDPQKQGMLYAGTETGVYVSFDDGANWMPLQLNLPVSPIHDLVVKDNDLVVATHGRSFWILDNVAALYQLRDDIKNKTIHLLKPPTTERVLPQIFENEFGGAPGKNYMGTLGVVAAYLEITDDNNYKCFKYLDSGANPVKGVVVTYYLKDAPEAKMKLDIVDGKGNLVKSFTSLDEETRKANKDKKDDTPKPQYAPANAAWNRFIWNMRAEDAIRLSANDAQAGPITGPIVPPGDYQVRLTSGDTTLTETFTIVKDYTAEASQADLQAQYDLLIKIRDKMSEMNAAINNMRLIRKQLDLWAERLGEAELGSKAKSIKEKVLEIEKMLMIPDTKPGWPDLMNHGVRLNQKLSTLPSVVGCGDYRPTDQSYAVFEKLSGEINAVLSQFNALVADELASFNQALKESGVSLIGA